MSSLDLGEGWNAILALANNFWWSWTPSGRSFFKDLADRVNIPLGNQPVRLLNSLSNSQRQEILADRNFLERGSKLLEDLRQHINRSSWWGNQDERARLLKIAFFSAEFGLHESLPIYSGGLGVLAGDILKGASDLGLPLVGVGLLYRQGYFHQLLSEDGRQIETYPSLNFPDHALTKVTDGQDMPLLVEIPLGEETAKAQIWRCTVGRVSLFLLDTDIESNNQEIRNITGQLYGGDVENRIRQEIVLGIGGFRALTALGLEIDVYHMNEGHSAFLALEQLRVYMAKLNLTLEQALAIVRDGHLFTTHTPVPAGHDVFSRDLMAKYFSKYAVEFGIDFETLLRLGRVDPDNYNEPFSMSVLGFRTSGSVNGVSNLHGHVSRKLWAHVWPGSPVEEVPISHVTNGTHLQTWLAPAMQDLFDKHLGRNWRTEDFMSNTWAEVDQIPDETIWEIRGVLRRRLIDFSRALLAQERNRRRLSDAGIPRVEDILDPQALTIGFARCFAVYKRATLLLRDRERLLELLRSTEQPIQFIFAGKAHPADFSGKEFIAEIVRMSENAETAAKFIFLEDYDMELARYLVQGVDVWLNNPRRPLEASGTSGMKAAINGALNLSVLDGWWCEAFDGLNGWAIGEGEEYEDHAAQDDLESRALYRILEEELVPSFYDRDEGNIPRNWIWRVKHSLKTITPAFCASRMVIDYARRFYIPHGLTRRRT